MAGAVCIMVQEMYGVKNVLIIGLIVILGVLGYPFIKKAIRKAPRPARPSVQEPRRDAPARKLITLDQYNRIQNGMKYDQVVKILGKEGTFEGEQTEKDDFGGQMTARQYSWKNGSFGGFMDVTFVNGGVAMKTQYGLK